MTGNILYELVALYLDLLHADKHLLDIFTTAYGIPDFYRNNFPRQALSMTLLHQFPCPNQSTLPISVFGPCKLWRRGCIQPAELLAHRKKPPYLMPSHSR